MTIDRLLKKYEFRSIEELDKYIEKLISSNKRLYKEIEKEELAKRDKMLDDYYSQHMFPKDDF